LCNGIETATNSLPQRVVFDPTTTVPPSTATIVDWAFTNANLYVVYSNGWVYSGGSNTYGQLGHGDTTDRAYLKRIEYFVTNALSVTKVWANGGFGTTNGGGPVYFQASDFSMYGCVV
jgi:alpha-tubulin suppressor-like RCC1 family protein